MATREGQLTGALRLLADGTRLRALSLLEDDELSVGELARALGVAQSRMSNHLRLLRDAGLLIERRDGPSTYLRALPSALSGLDGSAAPFWKALKDALATSPEHAADRARLGTVLAGRTDRRFFDRIATDWDKIAGEFETGQARQRAAASLLPDRLVLADLGCGTGYMAQALLGLAAKLILVDHSDAMLAQAEKRLARDARGTELDFRRGELDALPIADGELDGLVAGMVMHHLPEPDAALREMRRVLKPGASAAVLELAPHRESWMREKLGDRFLGIAPAELLRAFERAGFEHARIEPVLDRYHAERDAEPGKSLELFLVRARAPVQPGAGESPGNTPASASMSAKPTSHRST